jgi:NitT/TauT family transport system ATP-binding protein
MDEPFAALDAIVRHRITQDLLDLVEGEKISVLLVTHDLEEALVLSDVVYLLGQGPRARIRERYSVPISRPRDIMKARTDASFAPLLQRLWQDLSAEVDMMRRVA